MRWFKDATGKWYYGDHPYPTHTKAAPPVPRGEGLAETTGDVVVTAKGGSSTAASPASGAAASPFAAAAERSVAGSAPVIETEQQARRYLPPMAGESRARWLDRVGLGYLIQPGDEKRLPHVHSTIGPHPPAVADHGQSPTGGGDGLARVTKPRGTVAKAVRAALRPKKPPSPIHLPPLADHVSRRVLLQQGRGPMPQRNPRLQGPPSIEVLNVGRRTVRGQVVEEGEPTTFLVYPDGTRVQVNPPPDPSGTRVVRQPDGTYVKILPSGRRIPLGKHPYPTSTTREEGGAATQSALQRYWDSLSDEDYIREYGHPRSWAEQPGETIEEWSKRYDRLYEIYKARVAAGWKDPFKDIK